MNYKVGQKVIIRSLEWYNKHKDGYEDIRLKETCFRKTMALKFCGKVMTISAFDDHKDGYRMLEDKGEFFWTDEMIEGLVEEETALNKWTGLKVELELSKSVIGVSNVESLRREKFMSGFVKAIITPEGYIFKDENGNEILTSKIILEKKKKEYPKTYEACAKVLLDRASVRNDFGYKGELLVALQRLLVCRDAYWKIAGEEMGLGKPWENGRLEVVYGIYRDEGNIVKLNDYWGDTYVFEFPIREMRDAFYENFKELIENCKELL